MPTLERSNPLPLYYQLKEVLKQQIQAGHLAPHTAIPSEPELVTQYHVSRATVRQALTELVNDGLLYREHGRGTFVCGPRVAQHANCSFTSLSQMLRQQGKQPGGLLISRELVRGTQVIREHLQLADEEQACRLNRLRTADGLTIAYEMDYLPYPLARDVYTRAAEAAEGSLYHLMSSEGLRPWLVEQTMKAEKISAEAANLLHVAMDSPGMRVMCTAFDETGAPIAYSEILFPEGYLYQTTLRVS